MNRRTLLRRLGATGVAATTVAGTSAARTAPTDYGIDREIDVSDVAGRVRLDDLLEPEDRRRLPEDVDPAGVELFVQPDADVVALDDCCGYCCQYLHSECDCRSGCCVCDRSTCY